jgi:hypothetical protein
MESDNTTIRVKKTSRDTINEFCERTHTNVIDFIDVLTTELQKQLDLCEPNKRLLYMVDFYNKDNCPKTIIRLSDALASSLDEIPEELHEEIFQKFGYKVVNGHFIDTREKPTEDDKQ